MRWRKLMVLSGLSLRARGQGFPPGYFENDSKTRSIGNHRSWRKREPKELPSHSISYLPVASTNVKSWNHNDIFALSIIMNITRVRKWEKWITNWDEMIFNLNFNWNYNFIFSVREKKFRHYKISKAMKDTQERWGLRGYYQTLLFWTSQLKTYFASINLDSKNDCNPLT